MDDQPVIEVKNLGKKYQIGLRHSRETLREAVGSLARRLTRRTELKIEKDFWALREVSFSIKKGEMVGIIGSNGAGKSTLLKILSDIVSPTTGQVIIRGKTATLLEIGTGFNGELTGRENIYLSGIIMGMKKKEIQKKYNEIVEFSGIKKFIDTPVKRYSSGMQARLAFSVSAHLDADILFIDEVFTVGDGAFQRKSYQKMLQIAKNGRTILFVSHNLAAVENLCTRALWLKDGRLTMDQKVEKVTGAYYKETVFDPMLKEEAIPLARRTDRIGNGKVRLTKIEIENSSANNRVITCVDGIKINILIKSKSQTDDKVILLSILNEQGEPIFWLDSRYGNLKPKTNYNLITCVTDKLNIIPGSYLINAAILVDGKVADQVANAATFMVEKTKFFGENALPEHQHGSHLIKQHWKT